MFKKNKKEFVIMGILFLLFIILSVLVKKGLTYGFDKAVFNAVINLKSTGLTKFMMLVTTLASTKGIIVQMILAAFVSIIIKHRSFCKYIFGDVALGAVLVEVFKHVFKRVRPSWKWIKQDGFSYPSGHTMAAFSFYGTLIMLVNQKMSKKWKMILIPILVLMIFLAGFSRIYFGVHYLTDVISSMLLGTIVIIFSNIFANKEYNHDKGSSEKTI